MLKSLVGGILVAILIIIGIGLCLPSSYELEANVAIEQPVDAVFQQVNILKNWQNWAYSDTTAINNLHYVGPKEGVGAIYTWKDEHSSGRMEVLQEVPNKQIQLKLTTDYGVKESYLAFDFVKLNGITHVKWKQTGDVGL